MRGRVGAWLALGALACSGSPPETAEPEFRPPNAAQVQLPAPVASTEPSDATAVVLPSSLHAADANTSASLPRLAIVIDDLGFRRDRVHELLALGLTMTYAVLPAEPRTPDVVAVLQAAGVPIIVHMPMQPKDYPRIQPGPCAMLQADAGSWEHILRTCAAHVPGAQGLNNHMGSALTENREAMAVVARYLRETSGFFLDSVTSGRSVATEVMRAAGVPVVRRDVFLDDARDAVQITAQLQLAMDHARRHGAAVAIGHPYPETMRVLAAAQADGSLQSFRLVAARELAQ